MALVPPPSESLLSEMHISVSQGHHCHCTASAGSTRQVGLEACAVALLLLLLLLLQLLSACALQLKGFRISCGESAGRSPLSPQAPYQFVLTPILSEETN